MRGLEAWGNWRPVRSWRLDAGLLRLTQRLRLKPGSNDPVGPSGLGNDARFQWSLSSTHTLSERIDVRADLRHVDHLPSPRIPGYTAANFTFNWRARDDTRISFGIRDAFDRGHSEYQGFSTISEIPRSAFVALHFQSR